MSLQANVWVCFLMALGCAPPCTLCVSHQMQHLGLLSVGLLAIFHTLNNYWINVQKRLQKSLHTLWRHVNRIITRVRLYAPIFWINMKNDFLSDLIQTLVSNHVWHLLLQCSFTQRMLKNFVVVPDFNQNFITSKNSWHHYLKKSNSSLQKLSCSLSQVGEFNQLKLIFFHSENVVWGLSPL